MTKLLQEMKRNLTAKTENIPFTNGEGDSKYIYLQQGFMDIFELVRFYNINSKKKRKPAAVF